MSLSPQVSVNGKRLDLTYSFLGSRGVGQCYDSSPCERQPCRHGATCMPAGEYEFQCLCRDGFKGGGAPGPVLGGGAAWPAATQPLPAHLCPNPQETSVSTRRTLASSVSPVYMGAPARAPSASVPPASRAHAASTVSAPTSLCLPPRGSRSWTQPTNRSLPLPTGSGHGMVEPDWHLEGSGGNGMYWL